MRRIVSLVLVVVLAVSCVAASFSVVSAAEAPQLSWHYGDGNYAEANYPEINDVLVTGNEVTFRFFPRKGYTDWGYRFYVRTPGTSWDRISECKASSLRLNKDGLYEATVKLRNGNIYNAYDKAAVGDLKKLGTYDVNGCWDYKHEFTVRAMSSSNTLTGSFRGAAGGAKPAAVTSDGLMNTSYSAPAIQPFNIKSSFFFDYVNQIDEGSGSFNCFFWRFGIPAECASYAKYMRIYYKNSSGQWVGWKNLKIDSREVRTDENGQRFILLSTPLKSYNDADGIPLSSSQTTLEITARVLDADGDWASGFISGAKAVYHKDSRSGSWDLYPNLKQGFYDYNKGEA